MMPLFAIESSPMHFAAASAAAASAAAASTAAASTAAASTVVTPAAASDAGGCGPLVFGASNLDVVWPKPK